MKKLRWIFLTLTLLLALTLCACGNQETPAPADDPAQTEEPAPTGDPGQTEDAVQTQGEVPGDNAPPTDQQVLDAYAKATEAAGWVRICSLPTVPDSTVMENDLPYAKVEKFPDRAAMEAYFNTLFSKEVTAALLAESNYIDLNGALYTVDAARGTDITRGEESYEIVREGDAAITLRVTVEILDPDAEMAVVGSETVDFAYELVDGVWVFTAFPAIR